MAAKLWVFDAATNKWQSLGGGSATGGNHSLLTNLDKDDHPQYFSEARGDARYARAAHLHDPIYLRPEGVVAGANITITQFGDGTIRIDSTGGGGSGSGGDEVFVSPNPPPAGETELWVDTDATATYSPIGQAAVGDHGTLTGLTDPEDHPQYVLDSGDTMTGGLTLTGADGVRHAPITGLASIKAESVNGTAYLETSAGSGKSQGLLVRSYSKMRWLIGSDASTEAGGDLGTNLAIFRFADDGATSLGAALIISRSSGQVSVAANPTAPLGVSTKDYTDKKVSDAALASTTLQSDVAPSQLAAKAYVDSKMIVSDFPPAPGALYPVDTVWIEY